MSTLAIYRVHRPQIRRDHSRHYVSPPVFYGPSLYVVASAGKCPDTTTKKYSAPEPQRGGAVPFRTSCIPDVGYARALPDRTRPLASTLIGVRYALADLMHPHPSAGRSPRGEFVYLRNPVIQWKKK